jgi:hypothetical protein
MIVPFAMWPVNTVFEPSHARAQLNADPRRVVEGDRAEQDLDIMDWLGGARSVRATEVVGLRGYGKTLIVLTCHEVQDDQEDDGDDEEEDRWTPRVGR